MTNDDAVFPCFSYFFTNKVFVSVSTQHGHIEMNCILTNSINDFNFPILSGNAAILLDEMFSVCNWNL